MIAGGRLQNWDPPRGTRWMEWDRPAGDQDAAYAVLRNATAIRRGVGKDFLLFGRMLRPLHVSGINTRTWTLEGEANTAPAVEHATWQARDGRVAIALANWTYEEQPAVVDLSAYAEQTVTLHLCTGSAVEEEPITAGQPAIVSLPPHACAMLIVTSG
jgi:hypothetical protein